MFSKFLLVVVGKQSRVLGVRPSTGEKIIHPIIPDVD
jgi:hypothetical protein